MLLTELRGIAKALVAGASTAIATAIPLSGHGLNLGELLAVVGAFLVGAVPTWAIPNTTPPQTRNEDGSIDPGSAALGLVVGLLLAYLILR